MGTIKGSVPDEREQPFRRAAMEKFGHKRGSISKALEEAISEWLDRNSEDEREFEDPVSVIEGEMSDIEDKNSVELQEEAYEQRALNASD
ncbi:MAG: hypothetical protein ABEJ03_04270 [Candidatus Nanohaloarchaea archaeon]